MVTGTLKEEHTSMWIPDDITCVYPALVMSPLRLDKNQSPISFISRTSKNVER
jgi:hypothetical protein